MTKNIFLNGLNNRTLLRSLLFLFNVQYYKQVVPTGLGLYLNYQPVFRIEPFVLKIKTMELEELRVYQSSMDLGEKIWNIVIMSLCPKLKISV
ncbi:MAG: hypothetical protein FVQ77_11030 [Cytophagales bacterium]|nr:hypothetical protein [Cytophagales bacterium]